MRRWTNVPVLNGDAVPRVDDLVDELRRQSVTNVEGHGGNLRRVVGRYLVLVGFFAVYNSVENDVLLVHELAVSQSP